MDPLIPLPVTPLVARDDSSQASPIKKIPAEILCRIFVKTFHSPPSRFSPSFIGPHHQNMVLFKITAVCRHWRATASEYATLWTNIVFSTTALSTLQSAELFLSRSKEAMLSVHIWDFYPSTGDHGAPEASERLFKAISSQSHRISSCELSSYSPDFWKNWPLPAPNLRKLIIHGVHADAPPVFGGAFPQLETLTSLYHTLWPLGGYATLSEVELRNSTHSITLAVLLDALRGCEGLEKLSLHGYAGLERGVPGPAPIGLPRLLQIDLLSCDSALILEYLDTPLLTGPVVIYDTRPRQHILRCLPSNRRSERYLEIVTELHVVLDMCPARYHIMGSSEGGKIAFNIGAHGVGHWVRWTWTQTSIEAVVSCVHFSRIRTLVFTTDSVEVPWERWLPNLSHLRDLRVSCPRSEGILSTLLEASPEDGLPLCPSLNNIAIYPGDRNFSIDHLGLMKLILHRHCVGCPIRKLTLHKDVWECIQRLDDAWIFLIKSQSLDGDDVVLEILPEVDLRELYDQLHHRRGRQG